MLALVLSFSGALAMAITLPGNADEALVTANEKLKKKEYEEAIKDLNEFLKKNPTSELAIKMLTETYLEISEYRKATAALTIFLQKNPNNEIVLDMLVKIQSDTGDYKNAIKTLQGFLSKNPNSEIAGIWLCKTFMVTGQYDETKKALDDILKKNPKSDNINAILGQFYLETGKYPDAESTFKKILANNPKHVKALTYLADTYVIQGKNDEARKHFLLATAADPDNHLAMAKLGQMLMNSWKKEEAAPIFKKIETALGGKIPASEDAALALGIARFHSQGYEKSRNCFQLLCKVQADPTDAKPINPSSLDGYLYWGWIYFERMNFPRAEEKFAMGLAINPNHPELNLMRAKIHIYWGRYTAALKHTETGLKTNPNHPGLLNFSAFLKARDESYESAIDILQQSLKLNPINLETLSQLAATCYIDDMNSRYEKTKNQILKMAPKYAPLYKVIGDFLAMRIRTEDALEFYKKAYETDPDYLPGITALGLQYMRTPMEKEGYAILEKVWDKEQANPRVINLLNMYDNLQNPELFRGYKTKHFVGIYEIDEAVPRGKYGMYYMEKCWDDFSKLFKFEPKTPILTEEFFFHAEFSSRTSGLPGMAADGATYGQLVTILSPKYKKLTRRSSNWARVVRHELCHVFTIQLSNYRIPRWFTEAFSLWSEENEKVYWDSILVKAYKNDEIWSIRDLNQGFNRPEGMAKFIRAYCQAYYTGKFIAKEFGIEKMIKMVRLYGEKKKTPDVLKEALGLSEDEFDKRFNKYLAPLVKERDYGEFATKKEIEEWKKIVEKNPEDSETLGKLYWFGLNALPPRMRGEPKPLAEQRGKYIEMGKKALELDPENPYGNIRKAFGYMGGRRPNYGKAKECLQIALKKLPNSFHANYYLGFCILRTSRGPKAMAALDLFHKCKEIYPRSVYGQMNAVKMLASLYMMAKKTDLAQKELEHMCQLNLDDAWAFATLGKVLIEQKNWKRAIEILDEAIKIDPFNIVSQNGLALSLEKENQLEKAAMHYRVVIYLSRQGEDVQEKDIDTVEVQAKVAKIYDKLGNKKMAIRYATRVLRKDDTFVECEEILKKYGEKIPQMDDDDSDDE